MGRASLRHALHKSVYVFGVAVFDGHAFDGQTNGQGVATKVLSFHRRHFFKLKRLFQK